MVTMINEAFDAMALGLKRLPEAIYGFNGLGRVDPDDAVGHLEGSISEFLVAYRNFSNACEKDHGWHLTPQAQTLLALRSARSLDSPNMVRSFAMMSRHGDIPGGDECCMITFDDTAMMILPLCLQDFMSFLSRPPKENAIPSERSCAIRTYLSIDVLKSEIERRGLPVSRVFFDIMPMITNGALAAIASMRDSITPISDAGTIALDHFSQMSETVLTKPIYKVLPKTFLAA
ncbi:hypothetical protein ACOI1H_23650 [Loktanella sp. DJP18]|uniref:hypothetical protein n=1 Tax=Loktanella sp. DJP18 TaxID=3409788 RepID=UPI003BB5539C